MTRASRTRQLVALLALGLTAYASSAAHGQTTALVLREAVTVDDLGQPTGGRDTTGLERAMLNGRPIFLGDVLLTFGAGSLNAVGALADPLTGEPKVSVELASDEARAFDGITAMRIDEALALVLDGRVLTAPTVMSRIPNGHLEISGASWEEARELAEALRAATGASSLDAKAQQSRLAFRDSVDTDTPEAAARAFLRSLELSDWLTTADLLHPDTQAMLRVAHGSTLHLRADSVSLRDPNRPYVEDPRQLNAHAGRTLAVADVLETPSPGATLDTLSDAHVLALVLAVQRGRGAERLPDRVVGSVVTSDGTAFVVVDDLSGDPIPPAGVSAAKVFELVQTDSGWRLLLPPVVW